MNVENLIGEATEYDKKLALEVKRPKSWCKSVSAFANTLGGALVFGISDDDEIVGLTDPNGDAEKLSEIIKTRMEPIPDFAFIRQKMQRSFSFLIYSRERKRLITIPVTVFWRLISGSVTRASRRPRQN